ncbi:MAG: peroxidase [Actinobacteria bacterium]|nr:MAG: peroxidase [Actinomycetota bacterium]
MKTANDQSGSSRYSRRSFLRRAGAGAGAVAVSGGLGAAMAPRAAAARSATVSTGPTTFGRIFPNLPPFAAATDDVKAALKDLGKPGGLLDAKDDLSKGPVLLITEPGLSANNRNNPTHTAGTTFFGQFVDHDITFDTGSPIGVPTNPGDATNSRTPSLDLDSVYGAGPVASPQLYDSADHEKLRIGFGGLFEDVPRVDDGTNTAIVADPRNDEQMIISGLQCAFILFHNNAVDWARENGYKNDSAFAAARQLTTWHYHWLVVQEFLPQIVGQEIVDDVLRNHRRFYKPRMREGFIPVEFQSGAYRFGHSMVRPSYRANLHGDNGDPFFGMVFDPAGEGQADPVDLRGGARAPRRFIGWQTFFDFGDGNVKPNKRIDTKISTPLFNLPLGAIASHDTPQALPQRNLLRQLTWSMPSGQSVARAMGVTPLADADLAELQPYGFQSSAPLWYYCLKEAEVVEDGLHLGPVGGRIVAEVLIGLLQSDPASYLVQKPKWTPTLTSAGSSFRMTDFLTFAGVDPASRGQ